MIPCAFPPAAPCFRAVHSVYQCVRITTTPYMQMEQNIVWILVTYSGLKIFKDLMLSTVSQAALFYKTLVMESTRAACNVFPHVLLELRFSTSLAPF